MISAQGDYHHQGCGLLDLPQVPFFAYYIVLNELSNPPASDAHFGAIG
jgi:hypothetical protein